MAMVTTKYGTDMDTKYLVKKTGGVDNGNERTVWVEYWLNDDCVHRSVHIHLKQPIGGSAFAASF